MELVEEGRVPLRKGVERLMEEAHAQGIPIAVCSTSNERAVSKIVQLLKEEVSKDVSIFAGDIVKRKKPSGDIYNLAKRELGLDERNVCVIEDSFIGVAAAREAGMPCVVTRSTYTVAEDFSHAQLVLSSLDDPFTTLGDLTALVEGLRVKA